MHNHFLEPVDAAMVPSKEDCSLEENFRRAIELFLKKALHEEKPRDRHYIYLAPGGDYNVRKALTTKPLDHLHQWEEMLRMAELLPEGNLEKPATVSPWNGSIRPSTGLTRQSTFALDANFAKRRSSCSRSILSRSTTPA